MKRLLPLILAAASFGCVDAPVEPPPEETGEELELDENECGVSYGEPTTAVVRQLILVEHDDGVAPGLDLDGVTSDLNDPRGCKKPDLRDGDGNTGIDNQFAFILPALLSFAGEGLTSAIQRAINNGDVLLMLAMDRVDDREEDACVEVEMFRADARPTIGGLGLIEPGQTFDRDGDKPASFVSSATLEDGWVTAGPVELELPMKISQFDLFMSIREATLRYTVENDGTVRGFIAGALVVDELMQIIDEIDDGTDLIKGFRRVLSENADLDPDENGVCQRLSLAVEFEAVPAFVFPEESDPGDEE